MPLTCFTVFALPVLVRLLGWLHARRDRRRALPQGFRRVSQQDLDEAHALTHKEASL